jgi:hypothetical protein
MDNVIILPTFSTVLIHLKRHILDIPRLPIDLQVADDIGFQDSSDDPTQRIIFQHSYAIFHHYRHLSTQVEDTIC